MAKKYPIIVHLSASIILCAAAFSLNLHKNGLVPVKTLQTINPDINTFNFKHLNTPERNGDFVFKIFPYCAQHRLMNETLFYIRSKGKRYLVDCREESEYISIYYLDGSRLVMIKNMPAFSNDSAAVFRDLTNTLKL